MTEHLTSRQLVARALAGDPVPRPATGPLAVHYCARLAGVSLRQYTTDPRVLADSVVRYYDRFRPDAVLLSADTWVRAQAMGAAVAFVSDDQPLGGTGAPAICTPADIDRLPPPDPASQGRWPLMIEALRRIREALGEDVFLVACFDQYPFSLACALMGLEQLMLRLVDEPPMVTALMERGLEYGTAYAQALAAAGADIENVVERETALFCKIRERTNMGRGEVHHVDVIADAGAVRRRVIVSEDFKLFANPRSCLGHEGHEVVRDPERQFADQR